MYGGGYYGQNYYGGKQTLGRELTKVLSDTISIAENSIKSISKSFTDAIITSESFTKAASFVRSFTDGLSLTDTFTKAASFVRSFTDNLLFGGGETSTGPNSPGTAVNDTSPMEASDWINPGNILTSDDTYSTADVGQKFTNYLKATNFGFSIPAGATIDGILMEAEVKGTASSPLAIDTGVFIVKADGSIGTTNQATEAFISATESYVSYGSSSDLWGETWTAAQINDTNFGVVYSAVGSALVCIVSVDHIRMTVYYTTSGGGREIFTAFLQSGLTFVENIVISDNLSKVGTFIRSFTETLSLSETFNSIKATLKTFVENIVISDNLSKAMGFVRSFTETLSLSEAYSRLGTFTRSFTDIITLSDTFTKAVQFVKSFLESLVLTDSFTKVGIFVRSLTDTIVVSEIFAKAKTMYRSFSESLTLAESFLKTKIYNKLFTETIELTERFSRFLGTIPKIVSIAGAKLIKPIINTFSKKPKIGSSSGDKPNIDDIIKI